MQLNHRNVLCRFLLVLGCVATVPVVQAHDNLHVGQAAPPAVLMTLAGRHIATRDLRGHTVVLTFWASWCEPCRRELPLLSRYADAHRQQGLRVLGFCLDDDDNLAKVRRIAKQLSFPVGLLEQSSAHGYGRMWRIPVSFVIDRHGVLRYDGWKANQPAWTAASLNKVVGPLLKYE
jgi:cytochrome c biogenesis protein CcmG/thiol:disulfide interchange protein DsbE